MNVMKDVNRNFFNQSTYFIFLYLHSQSLKVEPDRTDFSKILSLFYEVEHIFFHNLTINNAHIAKLAKHTVYILSLVITKLLLLSHSEVR
jgi:hypothetical protein